MLFLGLLIYSLLFLPASWLFPLIPVAGDLPIFIRMVLAYGFSLLLAKLLAFLIDAYIPSAKGTIRNLLSLTSVRWLCLFTALAVLGFIFLKLLWFDGALGAQLLSFFVPALLVSGLNAIGYEVPLRSLEEEIEPGRVILPELPPLPEVKEEIVKTFQWKFEGKAHSLTILIRSGVYEFFKSKPRNLELLQWSEEYVLQGITGEIRELAYQLYKIGAPYGTYQEVSLVLSFVQQAVHYQSEEVEYPRYPVETLVEEAGDCEDFSILGAAILKCMGYEVALLLTTGHAALGVAGAEGLPGSYIEHDGIRYYYCEMTAEGWRIGQLPEKYEKAKFTVSPVPPLQTKVLLLEGTNVTPQEG